MEKNLSILRTDMATLIRTAREQSDHYYRRMIGKPNDTEPVGGVPQKIEEWTNVAHERLAVWNGYSQAVNHALNLAADQKNMVNVLKALAHVADIEARSPVRHEGAPSYVNDARRASLALSNLWLT